MLYLGMEILYTGIPIFIAMAVFGVYALKGGHLTADVAFPALAYLNMLHGPLMGLPRVIIAMVTARVSLRRLQDFVDADETSGKTCQWLLSIQAISMYEVDQNNQLLGKDFRVKHRGNVKLHGPGCTFSLVHPNATSCIPPRSFLYIRLAHAFP